MEVGTIKGLALQPGDVVQCVDADGHAWWSEGEEYKVTDGGTPADDDGDTYGKYDDPQPEVRFRIIRRANSQPKTWGEMTDAEKGALLLAENRGEVIEAFCGGWAKARELRYVADHWVLRIKPQPKRETEEIGWCQSDGPTDGILCHDTHRITFDTIDGKPVCDSIRMEKIK